MITSSLFGDEPRHTAQHSNASTWQHSMIELADGTPARNDSAEWAAECEAMTILGWDGEKRANFFEKVERHRGEAGATRIRSNMARLEPAYVLSLATKEARQAYLAGIQKRVSLIERRRLEKAIMELWNKRQAKACNQATA